jgi:undecaprenyl-diphosphatase
VDKRNLWLIVVPLILFAMLAICVRAGITVNFEGWAYNESIEHMSPILTNIVKRITHIGDSVVIIAFCLLLIAIQKSRKTIALPVSLTVILSMILNVALKNIFTRERPDILRLINETSYSFPSGHAMNNAALYTMLILLIFKFINNKPLKIAMAAVCIMLTVAIGLSRIYLGVHYTGDVLGGWLIGFAISIFIYFVWNSKFGFVDKKAMQ